MVSMRMARYKISTIIWYFTHRKYIVNEDLSDFFKDPKPITPINKDVTIDELIAKLGV